MEGSSDKGGHLALAIYFFPPEKPGDRLTGALPAREAGAGEEFA